MTVGNKELFITFKVEKSRYFRRDGSDIHTDAEISLSQALLGGTIRIQGIYEDQTVQVMPGTSSHHTITLKSQGLKRVNKGGTGDHYVHLKIIIPKKLNDKQKALVQAYAELEKDTPGQIFGVTFKSDGKSDASEEPLSDKFTQRPQNEDFSYEKHDIKDTDEYKASQFGFNFFFGVGLGLICFLTILVINRSTPEYVDAYRDFTLEQQKRRKSEESEFQDA
jgi:DnaJ-class molecular chaperone